MAVIVLNHSGGGPGTHRCTGSCLEAELQLITGELISLQHQDENIKKFENQATTGNCPVVVRAGDVGQVVFYQGKQSANQNEVRDSAMNNESLEKVGKMFGQCFRTLTETFRLNIIQSIIFPFFILLRAFLTTSSVILSTSTILQAPIEADTVSLISSNSSPFEC